MSNTIYLDYPGPEALPAAREIAEKARSTACLVLRFRTYFEVVDSTLGTRCPAGIAGETVRLPPGA